MTKEPFIASIVFVVLYPTFPTLEFLFLKDWWFYGITVGFLMTLVAILRICVTKYKIAQSLKMEHVRHVERERVRDQVAQDYHDELGGKLTKIALYSELLKRSMKETKGKVPFYLDVLTETCGSICQDARDFIWAINPENETLDEVGRYLKNLGETMVDGKAVKLQVHQVTGELASIKLPMEWKRQIVLIFKDCMTYVFDELDCHNATLELLGRSSAVVVTLTFDADWFALNGSEPEDRVPNLVRRLKRRAQLIHADVEVVKENDGMSCIVFKGQLPQNGVVSLKSQN